MHYKFNIFQSWMKMCINQSNICNKLWQVTRLDIVSLTLIFSRKTLAGDLLHVPLFSTCIKDNTLFDVLIHVVVNDSAMLSISFLFFLHFVNFYCTHIYKMFVIFFIP